MMLREEMREPIEIVVKILQETAKAYRVTDREEPKPEPIWIPKSQIEVVAGAKVGDVVEMVMPEWLAIEKELV